MAVVPVAAYGLHYFVATPTAGGQQVLSTLLALGEELAVGQLGALVGMRDLPADVDGRAVGAVAAMLTRVYGDLAGQLGALTGAGQWRWCVAAGGFAALARMARAAQEIPAYPATAGGRAASSLAADPSALERSRGLF